MKKKATPNNPSAPDELPEVDTPIPVVEPEVEAAETTPENEAPTPDVQAICEELKDRLLRQHAEFENYRKRTQREFAAIRTQAKAATVEEFLPVYDHFGMALAHANDDGSVLHQGMEMILAEFKRTFENLGVEEMVTVGQPFDPNQHEAIAQEPSDEIPEGHILRQWKSGFRLGDKLLRPAGVVVSAGKAGADEETSEN